jgi:hypothetical protein
MRLIGLTGAAGAGKDTVAEFVSDWARSSGRMAFAAALKDECAAAWNIDARVFSERAVKETSLEQLALRRCAVAAFCNYAWELASLPSLKPRTVMQRWGDFRRCCDPDYFLHPVRRAHEVLSASLERPEIMLVTDVRYPNEAALIERLGGVLWRVKRTTVVPIGGHDSEWFTNHLKADHEIRNDGSLDDLRRLVVDLLGAPYAS